MAPKPKRPSMLTRQRQLIKQRNQVKSQASKQLPPRGGTSANSSKATGQRNATRAELKARQTQTVLRALGENIKKEAAREARQIKPDPSPKTRYVGPNGANPKGPGSLPPGQRGGDMKPRGGPLTRRTQGQPTRTGGQERVQQVSVRDLGNRQTPQVQGQSGQRALPPGQKGGGLSKNNTPTQAGTRTSLGNAPKPATPKARGGAAAAVIATLAGPIVADVGQKMGGAIGNNVLKPIGRRLDDMLPGINSKDEANRVARATPLRQPTAAERSRAVRLENYNPPASKPAATPRSQASTSSNTSPSQRASSATSTPARSSVGRSNASANQPTRPKASTAQQSAAKTSESSQVSGIGPVKDGQSYANQKLSIKETVRELRQMQERSRERQKQNKK